ncbi:hydroxypyruvate isomerase family protein [Jiangella anatolica]|uniref:Hydroxypyruvate isomerase n=1 Tax=Jiangella anatolica TaxID=2670374 RepID=A0A2W2C6X9_9ACTN|nr:TIM barrel protein [Jiangella anatolica]PZF83857.1 hydroxypyruvate isomerase [Jiangella anatolica]
MHDKADTPASRTLAVNCSILLKQLPIAERLRVVRDAGFDAVEFWWPFSSARPNRADVDGFATEIERSGLRLVGLNLYAANMAAGDRGVLSLPGREEDLMASARIAVELAARLGTRRFNVLYGNRLDEVAPDDQDALAEANLRRIAPLFESHEGVLMIEAVSGAPAYPVKTAADAAGIVARARARGGPDNIGVLLDLYHLAANGDDVDAAIEAHGPDAAHVQIADAPGRGAPGTGDLPLVGWVRRLRELGYGGHVALEYADSSADPFDRLDTASWKELA